jgi:hypothetical protein
MPCCLSRDLTAVIATVVGVLVAPSKTCAVTSAGRAWLLLDRVSAHTTRRILSLADKLPIEPVWLSQQ